MFAALGCVAILGGLLAIPMQAQADNGPTYVADNRTLNTWDTINMAQSTKNVGRIWTDKSVSKDSIELKYGDIMGQTVTKTEGSDFLVALSALSSASTQTTVAAAPLDIVLVLDLSGSMDNNMVSYNYAPVYTADLDENSSYYIKVNGEDQSVSYNEGGLFSSEGWCYGSFLSRTYVTPKTGANDTNASHTQFYIRTQTSSQKKLTAMKNAATAFISATAEVNADLPEEQQHRVGLVKFASSSTDTVGNNMTDGANYTQIVSHLTTKLDTINSAINSFSASGQTRAAAGLAHAQTVLNNDSNDRGAHQVVIFFTDGQPNRGNDFWPSEAAQAVTTAKAMKDDGVLIYTIGVFSGANVENAPVGTVTSQDFDAYMHAVSSNYPDATATYSGGNSSSSSWSLTPSARAEGSDYYKVAADAANLNLIFDDIFNEIVTLPASPTVTDSGNPQASGYITFTDTLGAFAEVKDVNAIVYNDKIYTAKTKDEPVLAADGKTVRYLFTDSVTDVNQAHPGSYSLDHLIIEVTQSNDKAAGDTVVVKIPSALLPLRHYDIDDDGTLAITEAHPVRVLYSVGLKTGVKEAMTTGQTDSVDGLAEYVQRNANNGTVSFYSNDWDPQSAEGKTTAVFAPAATNNFYYYAQNTYFYVDEACTNMVTSLSEVTPGKTLYYKQEYYAIGETVEKFTSVPVVATESNINWLAVDSQGVYVPGGTAKYSLSNAAGFDYLKPNAGETAIGGSEKANATGTADYALSPNWSGGNAVIRLGNNGKISYHATGSISVTKRVEHAVNLTPNPDAEFTFQVALTAPAGIDVDGEYTYVVTEAAAIEDAPAEQALGEHTLTVTDGKGMLKIQAGQTATIYGLREGVGYTVTETDLPGGFQHTAVNGAAAGTVAAGQIMASEFVNTYTVSSFQFPLSEKTFPLEKLVHLGGDTTPVEWHDNWEFTFSVSAGRSDIVPLPDPAVVTLTKADLGNDNIARSDGFGKITFTEPGTYYYLITENEPEVAADRLTGISYSYASYEIQVTLVDNGDGTMSAVEAPNGKEYVIHQTYNQAGDLNAAPVEMEAAQFVNAYDLESVSWSPWLEKSLDDRSGLNYAVEAGRFTFYVKEVTPAGDPSSGHVFANMTNSSTGDVTFARVSFDESDVGNTYVYEMGEVIPADADKLKGITYDETLYRAYVTIGEEAGSAAVTIDVRYQKLVDGQWTDLDSQADTGMSFVNIYDPDDAVATLQVDKTLNGRNWHESDAFTFTLTPEADTAQAIQAGKLTLGTTTAVATQDAKRVSFGEITFHRAGTYAFRITEEVPTGDTKGISYDTHSSRVVVTVGPGAFGELAAQVVYENDAALEAAPFVNTYSAASLQTNGLFQVAKDFAGRPWNAGDTFIYRLILGNGNADATPAHIDITAVAAAPDGSLPTAAFTYAPVYKYDPDGTGTNDPYHGPYVYYIYERMGTGNPDNRTMLPGVTYDRHVYKVEVYVTDKDSNGVPTGKMRIDRINYARSTDTLSDDQNLPLKGLADMMALNYASITPDDVNLLDGETKTMVFHNTYAASEVTLQGNTAIRGLKTIVGRDMAEGERFTFTLTPDADYGSNVVFAQNAGTAAVSGLQDTTSKAFGFGAVTFKAPGTYSFSVKEDVPAQDSNGNTYDRHTSTVVVTVTDDLQGKLVASVVYDGDAANTQAEFLNTYYKPEEAKTATAADGTDLDNNLVQPGQAVTYTIDWVNNAVDASGKPVTATVTITDAIPANTSFVSASDGITPKDGKLTWTISAAAGEYGSVSFTVEVKEQDFTVSEGDTVPQVTNQAAVQIGNTPYVTNTTESDIPVKEVVLPAGSVQVGHVLDFTIGYSNPTGETVDVVVTDTLSAGLAYVQDSATVADGITFTAEGSSLKWTIANVAPGTQDTVTFQARVTEDALQAENGITNTAAVKVGDAPAVSTNTTDIPVSKAGSLTISKEVTATGGITAPDSAFTFQVDMQALDGQPLLGTYAYTGSKSGTLISGSTVTLKAGQSIIINGLPAGATVTVTEIQIPDGFKPAQPEIDNTIAADATAVAAFTNTFRHATLAAAEITVEKHVLDDFNHGSHVAWAEDYVFTFRLIAENAAVPMPAGSVNGEKTVVINNKDNPVANFGDIVYTAAGVYEYAITELRPNETPLGISFSTAKFKLLVTVTNADGTLVASKQITKVADDQNLLDTPEEVTGNMIFHNEYKLENVSWSPAVDKTLVNNSGQTLDSTKFPFAFVVESVTAGAPAPSNAGQGNAVVYGSGRPTFQDVLFEQEHIGKTFIYKFTERNDGLPGVSYDTSVHYAKVDVTGELVDNVFAVHIAVSYYKADGGSESITDGTNTISALTKVQPEAGQSSSMSFVNTYTPAPTQAQVQVNKVIDGRQWLTGETYTFRLTPVNGAPMPDGRTELTVSVGKGATGTFPLPFTQAGTYRYQISEVVPDTKAGGMTYDTAVREVAIVVTDRDTSGNYTGALAATVTDGQNPITQPITFTNTYAMQPLTVSDLFPVGKAISGRSWKTGDSFTFTLAAETAGAPMPANTSIIIDGSMTEKQASFGRAVFAKPGEYVYTVREAAGAISGLTYDDTVYTVRVVVTDNADGTMSSRTQVKLTNPADSSTAWHDLAGEPLVFTNVYKAASVDAVLKVNKTFRGVTVWKDGYDFTFNLTAATPDAPMPGSAAVTIEGDGTTGTVQGIDKSAAFGTITFTKAGTYTYTISESIGNAAYVIYDRVPVTAVINVSDDGNGQLTATVAYDGQAEDGACFVNFYSEYEHPPKSVENVTKHADGTIAAPGDILEYTIRWANKTGTDGAKVTIVDAIPAGTTFVAGSASNQDQLVIGTDGTLTWTFDNLEAGFAGRVTFQVKVDENHGGGMIQNVGYVNDVSTTAAETYVPQKSITSANQTSGIGQNIVYRMDYRNTTDAVADVTITDVLDERLTYVSASTGAQYTAGTNTVVWVIKNVQPHTSGYVTLTAKLNSKAIAADGVIEKVPNTATVKVDGFPAVNTNVVTVNEVPCASLTIGKQIQLTEGQGTEINTQQAFAFTVEFNDASGAAVTDAFAYSIDGGAENTVKHGETITLKHGQTAVIQGLPVGTQYTVTEAAVDHYTAQNGAVRTGVVAADGNQVSYVNVYKPSAAQADISVIKELTGRDWTAEDSFTFRLERMDGAPMPESAAGNVATMTVTSGAAKSFGSITFENAGTYLYKVTEADGQVGGITYDTTTYYVQVKVTDVDGQMRSALTYGTSQSAADANAGGTVTFQNKYAVSTLTVQNIFPVVKVVTGIDTWGTDWSFDFTVTALDGAPVPADSTITIAADTDGHTANFGSVQFTEAGEYYYTVQEIAGNIGGITYDPAVYQVKVIITDNGDGTLSAKSQVRSGETWSDLTSLTFTNPFQEAFATIQVVKNFNDWSKAPNGFGFKLEAVNGAPMPSVAEIVVKNGDTASFQPIAFQAVGTYQYKVTEMIPADANKIYGVAYDATEQMVTVAVSTDDQGALVTSVSCGTGTAATFTNTYTAPTKVVDHMVVGIGQEVTFTINYRNTTGSAATIVVRDTLDEKLDFVSAESTQGTAVVTSEGAQVKIVISGVPANTDGKVILKAKINEKALLGDIDNVALVNDHMTNKVTIQQVQPADLSFTKVITLTDGQNTVIDTGKEFTFTVQLKDAGGNSFKAAAAYTYQINGEDAGTVANGGTIKLKHGQTATILDLPMYTQYIITEAAASGYTVKDTGVLSGVLDSSNKAFTITNVYKVAPATINLKAVKVINGTPAGLDPTGQFAFSVYDNEGCTGTPVAAGSNAADGAVVFSDMTFPAAGEYTYYIKENANASAKHITFDTKVYKAVVTVTDNGQGELTAAAAYSLAGSGVTVPTFTNTYADGYLVGGFNVTARKYLTGRDLKAEEFSFGIYNEANDLVAVGINDASGAISFQVPVATAAVTGGAEYDIPATTVGEHWYTIRELDNHLGGVTYDETVYKIHVVVALDSGKLICKPTYYKDGSDTPVTTVEFRNTYSAKATETVTIVGTKVLEGREQEAGEFSFLLQGNGTELTATNAADRSFRFQVGPFDTVGTYTYTISEVEGDLLFVSYSDATYQVDVEVTDDGLGQLQAEVKYPDQQVVSFLNVYDRPIPTPIYATISGTKVLEGRDLVEGEFSFLLKGDGTEFTATNAADGSFSFQAGPFAQAGTYTYTLTEKAGNVPYVTYSTDSFSVTVVVTETIDARLVADVQYTAGTPKFVNKFVEPTPEPIQVILEGTKKLSGRDLQAKEFTFEIYNEAGKLMATGTNNAAGSIDFGAVTFEAAGTYSLRVVEKAGDATGVTYDSRAFTVVVAVTKTADYKLVADVHYTDKIAFENSYTAPPQDDTNPGTGDSFNIPLMIALCVLTSAAIVVLPKKRQGWK